MSAEASASKLSKDLVTNAAHKSEADINDSLVPLSNVFQPRNKPNTSENTNETFLTTKNSLQNASATKSFVKDSFISLAQNSLDTGHKNQPLIPPSHVLNQIVTRSTFRNADNTLQDVSSAYSCKDSRPNAIHLAETSEGCCQKNEPLIPLILMFLNLETVATH